MKGVQGKKCYVFIFHLLLSECRSYRTLSEYNRARGYKGVIKCDRSLPTAWYRFTGRAGNMMPSSCVAKYYCGTHAPGWLQGGHPTVAQGIVSRRVCFHWSSNCCQWSRNIRVRNCGAFYIYWLSPTPACNLRYCGNGGALGLGRIAQLSFLSLINKSESAISP